MAKTRKRGLALLMAVVLALSLLPVSALASGEDEVVHGALTVMVDDGLQLETEVDQDMVQGTWYSENEDVVTVDENGFIQAVGEGSANVYFEYTENEPVTLEALEEVPAVAIPETPAVEETPTVEETPVV